MIEVKMNTHEKVTIELRKNTKGENPPVRYCKSKNGKPCSNNFVFRPKVFSQISDNVQSITWNSFNKILHLQIYENSKCEVYQWLRYIKEISHEIEKSPFTNLDANCVVVTIQDHEGNDVADLRLKNVSLADHECTFVKSIEQESDLLHLITLSYQYEEFITRPSIDAIDSCCKKQDSDEEWQTVETP